MTYGPFDRSFFELDDEGTGIPWDSFVSGLSVWVAMRASNGRNTTVREAAVEFNVTDQTVGQAVASEYWMFISGPDDDPTKQFLEHDGL